MKPEPKEVTLMLQQVKSGDQDVVSKLVPLLYDELRQPAGYDLRRERPNHTLQTMALVHEAYLRLLNQDRVKWKNRSHYFWRGRAVDEAYSPRLCAQPPGRETWCRHGQV